MKKQEKSSKQEKEVTVSESLNSTSSKKEKKKSNKGDEHDDPQLQEFLQVMQPRSKSKLWANDTLTAALAEPNRRDIDKQTQVKGGEKKSKMMVAESIKSDEEENLSSESQDAEKQQGLVHNEVISDMDYFRSRVKKAWSDSESEGEADEDNSDEDADSENDGHHSPGKTNYDTHTENGEEDVVHEKTKDGSSEEPDNELDEPKEQLSSMKDGKEVIETGRLFVRNLPYSTTYVH